MRGTEGRRAQSDSQLGVEDEVQDTGGRDESGIADMSRNKSETDAREEAVDRHEKRTIARLTRRRTGGTGIGGNKRDAT